MISEYKNVLANKFMRDTNYIIIKDTDDLEELERQWELFNANLTVRQQRLSDDRSLQIWNMTNKQHYEALRSELMSTLNDELSDDDEQESITYEPDDEDVNEDEITSFINMNFDDFEIPDDENDITESVEESESIIPTDGQEYDNTLKFEIGINQDVEKDNLADQYEIDSNINIIGSVHGKTPEQYLANLDRAFANWNSQNQDHRKKSDDKCREIYGMSNIDRYNKLKGDILKLQKAHTPDKIVRPEEISKGVTEALGEFVFEVYKNMQVVNESESDKAKQHRRLNDTPYFTPSEMIDMGVHGNDNYYCPIADNDGLITNIKIPTWFGSYNDMCHGHVFEDYTKDWIDTLDKLYSDFDQIKESGDQNKILARKQSILDLGWNPEIPFTRRNRQLAAKRVSKLLDKSSPLNIFINLDKAVPDNDVTEEPVSENATSNTHKPVFMVFRQGKAPIISSGIKYFTKSKYSHSAISFDSSLTELHSYNMVPNPGIVTENIKKYSTDVVSVMAFFAPNEIWQAMKDKVMDFYVNTRNTVYDVGIIMNKLLKRDARATDDQYHQVCSTFVDTILQSGKVDLSKDTNIPDPGQLYNSAKAAPNKIIEVYNGPADKYDSKKVNKKMSKLLKKGYKAINEATKLPTGYTLRNATKDDTDNMFKWEMESIDPNLKNDKKVISYIKQDVQDSIHETKIIMYKNEPIGMLTTSKLNDRTDWWYIGEIYIVKEHRGKGIGTTLLKNEIENHDKIILQVAQSNTSAINLYKSLGFEITKKRDKEKMYEMSLDKTKESVTESVTDMKSHEKNDVLHNIELWESEESNVLWITGLSGSGKSTVSKELAREYKAEYVELDNIQRAKMDNWDTTGSKVLDSYIKSVGGLKNVFPYCNTLDKITWKDIVCEKNDCPKEFNRLIRYIINYADTHTNERFVVEGVQLAYCTTDESIQMISDYPIIIKMNGPLKTEFRREKRSIGYGIERGDSFIEIFKHVSEHVKNWVKGKFYLDNYSDLKYFKTHIGESASILNEVKQFPIEFDKEGNLIIYKSRVGSLSFRDEIDDSVKLLESYRNTNNIEGMKYELAKLWFINDSIEKKLKKRLSNEEYKELIDSRAVCLNVFKLNLEYVMKAEKGFNFSDYYNSTPFSDNSLKITANTIKYSMKAVASMI